MPSTRLSVAAVATVAALPLPARSGEGPNSRVQALGDGEARAAIAPRLTLVVPTGDDSRGLGTAEASASTRAVAEQGRSVRRVPWGVTRSTAAFAVMATGLMNATAASADPPGSVPRETIEHPSWSEFYLGAHFGWGGRKATATLFDSGTQSPTGSFGALAGGVQFGYAQVLGSRLLLGVEADVSVPNFLDDDDRVWSERAELSPGEGSAASASGPVARSPEEHAVAAPAAGAWNIHGQTTFVEQGYPSFHSPYQGAQSLSGSSQVENTVSATAFLGLRLWRGAELYFDPELMEGFGLSDTHGVAAFPNGEAQKSGFPVPRFNAARIFVSQTFGFGGEQEMVDDGPNQLPGMRDVSRLTLTAGKFAVTDVFLVNTIAGEPRTRFLNWNIYGTGAYDWTMDLLSWTWGALLELNQKSWAFRTGYFLLPRVANTNSFDLHVPQNGQYLAEFERRWTLFGRPGSVLLFGWLAHGNIGSYPDALAEPATTPNYPDVALTRGRDRFNHGFVVSAEQTITGALGVFARASWSPEKGESMGWTDVGRAFALGGTLRGAWWHRPDDTVGLAGVVEGLSPVARRYFAAGGMGTIIGDGRLAYRPEMAFETFYAFALLGWATATLDYQLVVNPAYNADRGPVSIFALRLHAAF